MNRYPYRLTILVGIAANLLMMIPTGLVAQQQGSHHPFVYTPQVIQRAKLNASTYCWAQAIVDDIFRKADEAVSQSATALDEWFYETTPTNQCDCPNCGHFWLDYVWSWSPDKPNQIVCNYCDNVIGIDTYPENEIIRREDPQGNIIPHPAYRDSTGKLFPLRQCIAYYKAQHAYDWIEQLGAAYALSGEQRYAEAAVRLLSRLASVYPGYALHDNWRFEAKPWGWAGKLTGWHLTDARILIQCAKTYDAIYHSPALNDTARQHIETHLFHLAGKMLTAVTPLQGISNDAAYRYGGVAIIGRTLQDHDLLSWVMNDTNGYAVFVDKLFYHDGSWHERTPAYHNMLCKSLYLAPLYLDGYSDSPSYTGSEPYQNIQLKSIPKLKRIHALPYEMRFPNGNLPPINDARWGTRPDPIGAEAFYHWTGDPQWLARLEQAYEGKVLEQGSLFSLFYRSPDIDNALDTLTVLADVPDTSQDITGMGLFMLRRGTGEDQTVFTLHHHKYANTHSHYDALSVMLYANGREMLSDLGYPTFGSRLRTTWFTASLSHNTLIVDTNNQRAPNGVANFLHHGDLFSACEGESWDSYRIICEPFIRQIALIDTDAGRPYAVDVFRADGGTVHDWALHGEGAGFAIKGVTLEPADSFDGHDYAYKEVTDVKTGSPADTWGARWSWPDSTVLDVHIPAQDGATVFATLSPGHRTRDQRGRRIHSLFTRRQGDDVRSEFIAIYDPHQNAPMVRRVEKMFVSPHKNWAVVLKVTLDTATDYILTSYTDIAPWGEQFTDGEITIDWQSRFGVIRVKDGRIVRQEWVHEPMEGLIHDI